MPFVYSNHGVTMRSIVETDYQPLPGEIVSLDFMSDAELEAAFPEYPKHRSRRDIVEEIAKLEALQTPRRLREAALNDEGRAWLAGLNAQINDLRTRL